MVKMTDGTKVPLCDGLGLELIDKELFAKYTEEEIEKN